jgi:hypothetical protein
MATGVKPPAWFWIVTILLVLWGAMGCWAWYMQVTLGAAAMGPVDDWSRSYFAALPRWYNYVYAVSVFGGLLGALALLLKERRSIILFWISLVGVVVMFGYAFAATDLIAHKGAAQTIPFPAFIAAVAIFQIWFAKMAARKGWIGAR